MGNLAESFSHNDERHFIKRRRVRHQAIQISSKAPQSVAVDIDTRHLAWQSDARCIGTDPETFFAEGKPPRSLVLFCNGCPVQAECLKFAIDNPTLQGVWAGTTQEQRARIRARTRRQERERAS